MSDLIAITSGDPSGIGPEISLKAVGNNKNLLNRTIIFGAKSIFDYYSRELGYSNIEYIENPSDFVKDKINIISISDEPLENIPIGEVSAVSGDIAYKAIEKAIELSLAEEVGPVITAPLNKEALHLAGHKYDGHTEIFAEHTNSETYTMMLWSEIMSVVHVSTHVSLKRATELVTTERNLECIHLANDAMKKLGVDNPKIAVAGLNPHSGENGLFGNEDMDEIEPAVKIAVGEGLNVEGPVPPDTVFWKAKNKQYDIVVAQYHDQGHIPMKLLAFDEGVNVTLGLPIIRASVDHGTAFDIAGKGIAKEGSMLQAIELGVRFSENS